MAALVAAASGAAAVAIASATAAKDQRSASRFGMFHRFPLVFYIAEHARAGIAGSLHTQAATGSPARAGGVLPRMLLMTAWCMLAAAGYMYNCKLYYYYRLIDL